MPTSRIILSMTCALAALAQVASAATVTLNPTKDAFLSSAHPDSNYGAAGALLVDAVGLSKGEFDSLLQFDFSSVKSSFDTAFGTGQWSIQSITLQLVTTNPMNSLFNGAAAGNFTFNWLQNDAWTEGTGNPMLPTADGITYNGLPGLRSGADEQLGTYSFLGGITGTNTWTLGLTSNFLADATAGNAVSLLALPADSTVSYTVDSGNFGTPASRPLLTVTAVPEPATTGLLLGGMTLGLLRRRRSVWAV